MSGTSASCPNSPRRSRLEAASSSASGSDSLSGLTEDEVVEIGPSLSSSLGSNSSSSPRTPGIHRSASATNAARPRTAPAGLYSYTGMWMDTWLWLLLIWGLIFRVCSSFGPRLFGKHQRDISRVGNLRGLYSHCSWVSFGLEFFIGRSATIGITGQRLLVAESFASI